MKRPQLHRTALFAALLLYPAVAWSAPDDLTSQIVADEQERELRIVGLTRFRASFPQRLSGSVGAMFVRQPVSYDCHTVCRFRGLIVQAEPGYSGGQLSIGYADLTGETGHRRRFLTKYFLGYGIKAALLRTWNGADLTPSDQTLAGVEGEYSVIGINFSLGLFHHVGSGDPSDPWLVTGGVGWGF